MKGVAGRNVARLHADLPEIGTLSNKAIAKLADLAPIADDSGKHNGKCRIRGRRAGVRSIFSIVAATVARHDKSFAGFRVKLIAAGKEKTVIRIALVR